ncbi:lipase family protein [Antrihabitans sp. YC2-6]|uniref:lipase family protein n=1 Tax=Antrihabitans sp. YC2-6 TaxID=2799498 RepID=UPI0018F53571|nr:lipase family protein [Antrihabitans sp. YC2-6]MBJ8345457.1 lipase [Antrihabitans sp. YC2-6]
MIFRKSCVLAIAASTFLLFAGTEANAEPVWNPLDPQPDLAFYLPTPLGDPWFDPAPGYEATPPGTVLATRGVSIPGLPVPTTSTQFLFRSTDSKGRPIAAATTVIVPDAPWSGDGPRPIVSYNIAIDSLGNQCAPSYTLPRGTAGEVEFISDLLTQNVAVVVTDYQGPRQSYSAGLVSGRTVLDSLRAARSAGLSPAAPIGITGYSGGAIASGWAAQLAPAYAPELNIAGVALGGAPTDYNLLHESMNGTLSSGIYLAAIFGVLREYPELIQFTNANGLRLMQLRKDQCGALLSALGILFLTAESLTTTPDAYSRELMQQILAENKMGAVPPTAPIFLYQGLQDEWIPKEGAENLQNEWCAQGASVRLEELEGDHATVFRTGTPNAIEWLGARLAGEPATPGCSTSGN